jgi:WD40 repeat protein
VADPAHALPLGVPLTGHTERVTSVVLAPDGRTLAIGFAGTLFDGPTVRLWDVADPAHPRPLGAPLTGPAGPVAFSPDGHTLASGADDNTVRLWDVADPAHPHPRGAPLTGHTGPVSTVTFTPDGHTLATGADDNTVRLWDVADPAHPHPLGAPLTGHTDAVLTVVFGPDGHTLATGSHDNTVRLWDANGLAEARRNIVYIACAQAGGLDRATWEHYVPSVNFPDPCKP